MADYARNCPHCDDSGWRDTGGVQPWGEAIIVVCECSFGQANMSQTLYNQICAVIQMHSEADADEGNICIKMHPKALADLRTEMGPDSFILKQYKGRFQFGDYPIEETAEIDGWKVASNLSD